MTAATTPSPAAYHVADAFERTHASLVKDVSFAKSNRASGGALGDSTLIADEDEAAAFAELAKTPGPGEYNMANDLGVPQRDSRFRTTLGLTFGAR